MSYLAIYLGIICGYILRFLKIVIPTPQPHKKPKILWPKLKALGRFIIISFQKAKTFLVHGVSYFANRIKAFFLSLHTSIKAVRYRISLFRKKLWGNMKLRLLANNYIYICAKVARIYSGSGNSVRLLSYNSIPNHCRTSFDKITTLEPAQMRQVCIPDFFEFGKEKIEQYPSPEIYVAELHDICLFGGSSILLSKRECLYDPFTADTEKRLDIKFTNIAGKAGKKIIVELTPPARQIETGIFLMGFASYNYYHLSIEIMSRLKYVDSIEKYRGLPLLVDEVTMKIPQYRQLVNTFNLYHHPIVEIAQDETIEVHSLIFPSYNTWMPINVKKRELIKPSDFLMAKSGLENVRSYINFSSDKAERNIFISRKNLTTTRLGNEENVVALFRKYNFEIIYTEELTYDEQVKLFHQAKCVAGASGAALTNIAYCQPGADIVCIIPEEYNFYMYSTMAYLLGLKPIFLNAFVTLKTPYTASDVFEIDLDYCERFLKSYIERGKST